MKKIFSFLLRPALIALIVQLPFFSGALGKLRAHDFNDEGVLYGALDGRTEGDCGDCMGDCECGDCRGDCDCDCDCPSDCGDCGDCG